MDKIRNLLQRKRAIDLEAEMFLAGERKDSILDLQAEKRQIMSMLSAEMTKELVSKYFSPLGLSCQEAVELLELVQKQVSRFAKY